MIKSMLKAHAMKRGARFLPGGWVTMLALSPQGRMVMRKGWDYAQKQQRKRSGSGR
jgi:hypothetical protein